MIVYIQDETDFGLMNVTSTASGITKQQQRHPTKTISDTEKDLYRFQTVSLIYIPVHKYFVIIIIIARHTDVVM